MHKIIALPAILLAGALATAGAFAQDSAPQGSMPGMQHMPMMQGQGGMMMDCPCPMMQRMASLDYRVRQLEERAGIPAPAQPNAPVTPR
ncbi:hypothetical protein ACFQY5_34735 [Paeniroseomonas aquatica]|uniref:Uncharacterized protein n=1 Tax=Paeniroseomonas aquatica TaxID=373043 RepID=A0ABT8AG27_9PROT|nr:hypothetical protein [Paeniroseomonas aquatica]MDN3568580.1 hypothetical protein [Paeniroseomonas aquatica]